MRQVLRWTALAMLVLLAPAVAAQQKQDKNGPANDQDYKALAQMREVSGKLAAVQPSGRGLTLRYEYQLLEPKGQATPQMQSYLQQQQQLMQLRNPWRAAQELQQLQAQAQRQAAGAFKTVNAHKDFELEAVEDVKVRTMHLPVVYDDKGQPRKYSDKELRELKGPDTRLPGYQADFDGLKPGQTVKLTLTRKKPDAAKDKEAPKEDDKDKAKVAKPLVTMIVIVKDSGDAPGGDKGKK